MPEVMALASRLRGLADSIRAEFSYVAKVGVAGLQDAPYSMTQPDAQALYDAYNYLNTIASIYYGEATQSPAFDFDDALALVRGGQTA